MQDAISIAFFICGPAHRGQSDPVDRVEHGQSERVGSKRGALTVPSKCISDIALGCRGE